MQQAFEVLLKFNEYTEVRNLRDGPFDDLARNVILRHGTQPRIFRQLLQAKSNTLLVFFDLQNNAFDPRRPSAAFPAGD